MAALSPKVNLLSHFPVHYNMPTFLIITFLPHWHLRYLVTVFSSIVLSWLYTYCVSYITIFASCSPKIRRSANQHKLMPIYLVWIYHVIFIFLYCMWKYWVCYFIFSHNFFDFSHEGCSICELYAIRKSWNMIHEKPTKTSLHTSPFLCYRTLQYTEMCVTR